MKRDMDLVRRLLMEIEARGSGDRVVEIEFDDVADEPVQYHLGLMKDAGLIHAIDCCDNDAIEYQPTQLTWDGHEFLEAARNETLWGKAKSTALQKTGGLTFDVLLAVLKDVATRAALGT